MKTMIIVGLALGLLAVVVYLALGTRANKAQKSGPHNLKADHIQFQFAIYYLPKAQEDPIPILRDLIRQNFPEITLINEITEKPSTQILKAYIQTDVQSQYAPPSMDMLQRFGFGIDRAQAETLQDSKEALILDFAHPASYSVRALRQAYRLTEEVARRSGGLLWDEQTRHVFSPDAWHKDYLDSWAGDIPYIPDHIAIHAYKKSEYVRAITLGMSKFGFPDVVIDEFSWSQNRTMGHLINFLCQVMAEGATFDVPGEFDLKIKDIGNERVREPQLVNLKENASGLAKLKLTKGKWEEGDPLNRLIEINFDHYPGKDLHARQEALLGSLFGWEDSISPVKHEERLLAASQKAKTHFSKLKEAFLKGLQPGEYIMLKAPFDTPDGGTEWMWVEVSAWDGEKIKGLLKNEPYNIPDLHGGQEVEVSQDDVFDYIRRHPDGREEGNETSKIIQEMQESAE